VSHGGVDAQPLVVVDIFITGQSAVDRLPEQRDKAMLLVLAQATILQVVGAPVSVSASASSSSRYASNPASVVTWLPMNLSFKRPSKSTRNSPFWQSPIGFSCLHGTNARETLVFQGYGANRMPNQRFHLGNAGLGPTSKGGGGFLLRRRKPTA
jgi:hypothetical protein